MDETNNTDVLPATPWHPLFALVIKWFAPKNRETFSEVPLSRLPLRLDILVVERDEAASPSSPLGDIELPAAPIFGAHKFRSIFDYLRKHTLIEYKGVTDDLEPADVFTLLAYASLYMRERSVFEPNEICLMVVADRISKPFIEQVKCMGGELKAVGNGLYQGHLGGLPLHGVELREAYKSGPSERLMYAFTRAFLEDHGPIKLLDNDELAVYRLFVDHVQQLRGNRATMQMKDLDLAVKSYEDALNDLIALATPEQCLARLTPEQCLTRLTPEQRLAGLGPEQVLLALPDDILRGLSPECLRTLSDATRAAIRARIGG